MLNIFQYIDRWKRQHSLNDNYGDIGKEVSISEVLNNRDQVMYVNGTPVYYNEAEIYENLQSSDRRRLTLSGGSKPNAGAGMATQPGMTPQGMQQNVSPVAGNKKISGIGDTYQVC